jgi:hypothetical protein|tara:strand:- start:255 stop:665 length:411 start_codon:yes stop_codon:yes gene_type:complete
MADTNTNTTIIDGDKKVVQSFVHTYVDTGEGTAVKKIDVSALATNTRGQACTNVRITRIWFSTHGLTVKILGNATTNVLLIELPTNYQGDLDFTSFGGIPNTAKGTTGADGDIYFSTHGEGSNDTYTVIIEAIKEY